MEHKANRLGFTKSHAHSDLWNLNNDTMQICILVQGDMIKSISFNVLKDGQPEYEFAATSSCALHLRETVRDSIVNAVLQVSRGDNKLWNFLVSPMSNPVLRLK